jgi:hypothetical protein
MWFLLARFAGSVAPSLGAVNCTVCMQSAAANDARMACECIAGLKRLTRLSAVFSSLVFGVSVMLALVRFLLIVDAQFVYWSSVIAGFPCPDSFSVARLFALFLCALLQLQDVAVRLWSLPGHHVIIVDALVRLPSRLTPCGLQIIMRSRSPFRSTPRRSRPRSVSSKNQVPRSFGGREFGRQAVLCVPSLKVLPSVFGPWSLFVQSLQPPLPF